MRAAVKHTLIAGGLLVLGAAVAVPTLLPRLTGRPVTQAGAADKSGATKSGPAVGAAVRVSAITLTPTTLAETISATGTLRADEAVELQPETNGKIVAITFTEGAHVRRGDLLLRLNDAELRATLQRTVYRRELAAIKERRLAVLLATKSVNQQDYDAAASELSVQQAEVALAEAQLAKMEIRAPFDGVVGLRFVSEGAFVTPTIRVATLQRLEQLKVDFSIPEKYGPRIRLGSPLTFVVDGGERKYRGEIYAIDPRIDAGTRTVLIRAVCPNPDGRLLPGAFANVEFTLSQVSDALLVPSGAVIPGLTEKNVFVVREGRAVRRPVQTGVRTETSVQILDGLTPGDLVITSGLQQLRVGQAVQIAPAAPTTPAAKQRNVETATEKKAAPAD